MQKKKRKTDSNTNKEGKNSTLIVVGSILFFLSWGSQNYFQQESSSEIDYLKSTQMIISIEEGRMTQWLIKLNDERSKDNPNKDILLGVSLKYIESTINLLAWGETRIADNDDAQALPIVARDILLSGANMAHNSRDLPKLIALTQEVTEIANKHVGSLTQSFKQRLWKAREQETLWNRIFLITYIFASLLAGLGFLKRK